MPRVPFSNSTISPAWTFVQTVDAGNAVTDGQHLSDFGDFSLLAEILDLVLEDRGKFPRARMSIRPASFIAVLDRIEFGAKRAIDHAAAELEHKPRR